jgi:hypothetical protein
VFSSLGLSNTANVVIHSELTPHDDAQQTPCVPGHPVWLWSAVHKSWYAGCWVCSSPSFTYARSAPASHKCVASAYSHPIAPHCTGRPSRLSEVRSIRLGRWTVKHHLVIALQPDVSPGGLRGSAGICLANHRCGMRPETLISVVAVCAAPYDVLTSSGRLRTLFVRNTRSDVLLQAVSEKVRTSSQW